MHQHLVDHHLEEQRRDQGEQLQEEGSEQHLAEEMAIFVDGAMNQVMSNRRAMSAIAARRGHQDQVAVPDRDELGPAHQGGTRRVRRLNQDLVVGSLGHHHEPAVAQHRDGRQRRPGQPRPVGPIGPRLEPQILGAAEHLRCANLVGSQPVPDLSGIGRDALEMEQRHEGFETRRGWSRAAVFGAHVGSPGRRNVSAAPRGTAAGSTALRRPERRRRFRPSARSSMPRTGRAGSGLGRARMPAMAGRPRRRR